MDSYSSIVCALIPSLLLTLGCARTSGAALDIDAVGDRQHTAFEARPSPAAAGLLAADAHYRVVFAADGELALLVVAPDQRILGRLHIRAEPGPHQSMRVQVELDFTGPITRVEAWSSAGGLSGQASVGDRAVRWRVRHQADGELAGERWTLAQRGTVTTDELMTLHRGRALGADLGALLGEREGFEACELAELLAFTDLALELSARAWAGRGRTSLPTVPAAELHDDLCAL